MDTFIYLIGGAGFLIPTIVICYRRKDLRGLALLSGLCGAIAAIATEPIFVRDYWHPPHLLGWHSFYAEDILFGFGVTALIAILYPALMRLKFSDKAVKKTRFGFYTAFAMMAVLSLYFFIFVWGFNSVLVSAGLCFAFTPIIWIVRRDLIKPSLIVMALVVAIVLVMYILFFDTIVPDWWDKYWLLVHTRLGITILGNVPITELVWYAGWALFASIIWPFSKGKTFEPVDTAAHKKT